MPRPGSRDRLEVGLQWLTRLRWGSAVGQLLTVLLARFALRLEVPLAPLLALAAATALTNVLVVVGMGHLEAAEERVAGGLLGLDTLILAAMLRLTGGPLNPFSVLFLVYITLAAVILGPRWTWFLAGLSVACYGALFFSHRPLKALTAPHEHAGLSSHLQGMWWAFCVAAALIAYFVAQLAAALERREREIAEFRERAARNERLASLTTLAAGAAHELGTPLATIAVAARELERAVGTLPSPAPAMADDTRLIRAELQRCRRILDEMAAKAGENAGEPPERVGLDRVLRESLESFPEDLSGRVIVEEPLRGIVVRAPQHALARALANLVRNALDAGGASGSVTLRASLEPGWLRLAVTDRGEGMSAEILARAGEPFFSTKPAGQGMGLGLFLARTLVERLGGRLRLESSPGAGTTAWLELPSAEGA